MGEAKAQPIKNSKPVGFFQWFRIILMGYALLHPSYKIYKIKTAHKPAVLLCLRFYFHSARIF